MSDPYGLPSMIYIDERCNLNTQPVEIINKGGEKVYQKKYVSQNVSDEQFTFSVTNNPLKSINVKRHYVKMQSIITFGGNPAALPTITLHGKEYLAGGFLCLRKLPLQSCCNSVQLKLNNEIITVNQTDLIDALTRYCVDDEWVNDMSSCPLQSDTCQSWNDHGKIGSARSPMGLMGENSAVQSRGSLMFEVVTNNINDVKLKANWMEPLILSPLSWNKAKYPEKGFAGISSIDLEFNIANLLRTICFDATLANFSMVNPKVTLVNASNPELHLDYIFPPPNMLIPNVNTYSYGRVNCVPFSSGQTLAAGATSDYVPINSITLKSFPSRIYVYVGRSRSDKSYLTPDVYCRIDGIKVDFNGSNSLFGTCDTYDLWRISREAGNSQTFAEWNYLTGSVFCIEASNLPQGVDEAAGCWGLYQFQIEVQFTNLSNSPITPDIYTVIVNEGAFTIDNLVARTSVGALYSKQIMDAEARGDYLSSLEAIAHEECLDYTGGSFFNKVKRFAKRAAEIAQKGVRFVKEKALPAARQVVGAVEHLAPEIGRDVRKGLQFVEKYAPAVERGVEMVAPLLLGLGYTEDQAAKILAGRGISDRGIGSRRSLRYRQ